MTHELELTNEIWDKMLVYQRRKIRKDFDKKYYGKERKSIKGDSLIDFNNMKFILCQHPEAEKFKFDTVVDFFTKKDDTFSYYKLHWKKENGETGCISYEHCFKKNKSLKSDEYKYYDHFIDALRTSILEQIKLFKKDKKCCEICKSEKELVTDHKSPLTFNKLVYDFLKSKPENTIPNEFGDTDQYTKRFLKKDYDFTDEWIAYHYELNNLQAICKECHKELQKEISKNKDDILELINSLKCKL